MKYRIPNYEDAVAVSAASHSPCQGEEVTRQEYAPECDIGLMLRRHGGVPETGRQGAYMEVDYDVRLSEAMQSVQEVRDGFARLPLELRQRFPDWASLMEAARSGVVEVVDGVPRLAVKRADSPVEQPKSTPEG